MQAYIKYKAYYDKKTNASKLREQQNVYNLQLKADYQGSKITFIDFRWIGHYIVENALRNNNFLVRKLGTNKIQVLHCMRLRLFTPRQPILTVPKTSQDWKPDPKVIIKHDDLYARAWESDYKTPISNKGRHESDSHSSPELSETRFSK